METTDDFVTVSIDAFQIEKVMRLFAGEDCTSSFSKSIVPEDEAFSNSRQGVASVHVDNAVQQSA